MEKGQNDKMIIQGRSKKHLKTSLNIIQPRRIIRTKHIPIFTINNIIPEIGSKCGEKSWNHKMTDNLRNEVVRSNKTWLNVV